MDQPASPVRCLSPVWRSTLQNAACHPDLLAQSEATSADLTAQSPKAFGKKGSGLHDDTSRGAPWLTLEVDGRVGLAALQHVFRVMPSLGYAALICSAQLPSSSQSGLAVSFQEGRCGALAFKRLLLDTAGRQQASMGGFFLTLTKIRRASFARSHSASHVCIGHSPVRLPQTGLDRTIEWSLRQRA
ncbi:uncharacterized protein LOC115892641 isoform X2 [Rhinopithecus roxellana]|uniref:uncharacterized protein LOC115892641 isoform X2 n=1 Tax=Rhinopithecus roxellana TaxID=61622 RepID=UPI0012379AEF|nr:uncharacterized protein LOC115892641 isoform X2 [Rhinopithecus roxellana]